MDTKQDNSATAKPSQHQRPRVNDGFSAAKMLESLDGGVFGRKLDATVRQCAKAVYNHNDNRVKAKITVEITLQRVGDGLQQQVTHKIDSSWPTPRGKKREDDTTSTVMFTNDAGALTVSPEKQGDLDLNR